MKSPTTKCLFKTLNVNMSIVILHNKIIAEGNFFKTNTTNRKAAKNNL